MGKFNVNKELKFIHSEKMKISDKESSSFDLLNIASVLVSDYININKKNKFFYKIIYQKIKSFYLEITEH